MDGLAGGAGSAELLRDQRLYNTHWRERFLGLPQQNPEGYDRSSTMTEAASLTRPLLMVHGMTDDNVVVAHTLRMSAALLAAGRPHQVLPLSRTTHTPAYAGTVSQLLWHELAFLAGSLGAARPGAVLRCQRAPTDQQTRRGRSSSGRGRRVSLVSGSLAGLAWAYGGRHGNIRAPGTA